MIDANYIYELFSDIYYTKEFPVYNDQECSVTEAVQCLLKSFMFRKVKRPLMNPKIVILSFGDLIHMALREPLRARGFECEYEATKRLGNYTLYSHTDALREDVGVELKTISRTPHEILEHHFLQANTYTHVNNLREMTVAYIHKPSGLVYPFILNPSYKAYEYVTYRAVRLCSCLERNTMPKPEPSWLCQYCEYMDVCPSPMRTVRGGFY